MSNVASGWAWKQYGLKTSEKMTLLALADHSDDEGVCWPGQRGLAKKTGLTRNTVKLAIRELMGKGLMSSSQRVRDDNSRASNLYVLHLNGGVGQSVPHPDPMDDPGVGQPATQHEPSENHQNTTNIEKTVRVKSSQQKKRVYSAAEVLLLFEATDMEFLSATYPRLDFAVEAAKWAAYWEPMGGVKNAKVSFQNWLEKAEKFRQRDPGRSEAADPKEYGRRYAHLVPEEA